MTPEQIAADRIARAVEKHAGWSVETARSLGKIAVEYMSAAGLVIMTAERAAGMLDALTAAAGWIANERREIVECHTVPDASGGGDESTMDDVAKEAVAEIDTILGRIAAVMWRAEDA